MTIYETYNPGALCVLYAFDYKTDSWVCIWSIFEAKNYKSNKEACERVLPPRASRMFEPKLTRKNVFSDKLRLEFEHSTLDYYTELDAVEIAGMAYDGPGTKLVANNLKATADLMENLTTAFSNMNSNDNLSGNGNSKNVISHESNQTKPPTLMKQLSIGKEMLRRNSSRCSLAEKHSDMMTCANIVDLPKEILCMILTYLDLRTIFRLRSTCQTFQELCTFGFLFNKLDLQPYWHLVS